MQRFPYQLETLPYGCYCNRGLSTECKSREQQAEEHRQSFIQYWDASLSKDPRAIHQVGQQFAHRYGWGVQRQVEQALIQSPGQVMPYMKLLGCSSCAAQPQNQGGVIYDNLLGRQF